MASNGSLEQRVAALEERANELVEKVFDLEVAEIESEEEVSNLKELVSQLLQQMQERTAPQHHHHYTDGTIVHHYPNGSTVINFLTRAFEGAIFHGVPPPGNLNQDPTTVVLRTITGVASPGNLNQDPTTTAPTQAVPSSSSSSSSSHTEEGQSTDDSTGTTTSA